ncbi:MAG: LytTR family DNA-binding domain-containing protein [Granulosicoccus sp.]
MSASLQQILIVEDEPPSRDMLASLINTLKPNVDVQLAGNGKDAFDRVLGGGFDIAFLDIDLPDQSGIELAENLLKLSSPPILVFATASMQHAIRGFELNIADYIVKPFQIHRIEQALDRAEQILASKEAHTEYTESLQRALNEGLQGLNKIWAERDNGGRVLISHDQIGWASARDKTVYIRTAAEELTVRLTLDALEGELPDNTFLRVHRSHLININLAREVIPWDSHSMTLIMGDKDNTEIPVSRKYAKSLKRIVGW